MLAGAAMTKDELQTMETYSFLPKSYLADRNLSPGSKLVLMCLIDHLGPINGSTWPGLNRIADETGLTRRGVQKAIDQLMALGYVSKIGTSEKNTNLYVINRRESVANLKQGVAELTHFQNTGSEQIALVTAHSVRHHQRTECATPSEQSAPELLNITTEITTKDTTESMAADAAHGNFSAQEELNHVNEVSSDESLLAGEVVSRMPAAKPKVQRRNGHRVLTADEEKAICANANSMGRYLSYGLQGLNAPDLSLLPPTPTNWRQYGGSNDNPKAGRWSLQAFMGYYWYCVSLYRQKLGIPITLPDFGLLGTQLKTLLATMPNDRLVKLIATMTQNFDLILHKLRRMDNAVGLELNETTLNNGMVLPIVNNLSEMGPFQLRSERSVLAPAA